MPEEKIPRSTAMAVLHTKEKFTRIENIPKTKIKINSKNNPFFKDVQIPWLGLTIDSITNSSKLNNKKNVIGIVPIKVPINVIFAA